jgi:hypothetical protein
MVRVASLVVFDAPPAPRTPPQFAELRPFFLIGDRTSVGMLSAGAAAFAPRGARS